MKHVVGFSGGYSVARYLKMLPYSENVYGLGIHVRGSRVLILHVVRVIAAVMFISI